MITDKEMIELGFEKVKTYKKKETGVSSFCWMKQRFTLSIMKYNNDDYFSPVLVTETRDVFFEDIKEVRGLMKLVGVSYLEPF